MGLSRRRPKRRMDLGERDLLLGSESAEVVDVQAVLARLGYLTGGYTPGCLCRSTERAVRRYQRFFHLKPDGVVGSVTKGSLTTPRCGVPDLFPVTVMTPSGGRYEVVGCHYSRRHLTYALQNHPEELAPETTRAVLRQAFDAWSAVAGLSFEEVDADRATDFVIGWQVGEHGCGDAFDDAGGPSSNVLAHAFFPPPCGGLHAGSLHFDAFERWTDSMFADDGFHLLQVAIHEIGHLLGLKHSQVPQSIMYPAYEAGQLTLHADDIAGAQALYGAVSGAQPLPLSSVATSALPGTGHRARFVLDVPRNVVLSIEGPADADFDVYVRRDEPPDGERFDYGAWTMSASERLVFPLDPQARQYFVDVVSYEGGGDFTITVEGTQ
jgi:hypothetical protein